MGRQDSATKGHDLNDDLISLKQLAAKLGRSYNYVLAMRRRGFKTVAGRTTLRAAITWLGSNPKPTAGQWWRKE